MALKHKCMNPVSLLLRYSTLHSFTGKPWYPVKELNGGFAEEETGSGSVERYAMEQFAQSDDRFMGKRFSFCDWNEDGSPKNWYIIRI